MKKNLLLVGISILLSSFALGLSGASRAESLKIISVRPPILINTGHNWIDASQPNQLPLSSVLVREKDVFAANKTGLFRALKADQRWQQLSLPKTMPQNGLFADQPKNSSDIWYFVPDYRLKSMNQPVFQDSDTKVGGLYHSRDDGEHWELINKQYEFRTVFLHPNGALYAIIEERMLFPKATARDRIISSRDNGQTWSDITGNLGPGGTLASIFRDPDHPDLVCLHANFLRAYIIQAPDDKYEWQLIRVGDWMEKHTTEESFFYRSYSTGWIGYGHGATLANYFNYDFGNDTDLPGFNIVPEKKAYVFALCEPAIIKATIQFMPPIPIVKLIDMDNQLGFWGMRVLTPKGERITVHSTIPESWYESKERQRVIDETHQSSNFHIHSLSVHRPYSRMVDIGKLYSFAEKGTYKVQLYYDNLGIADRERGEWPGSFAGEVFEVTIK